jgi:helicase/secretion neighborhood TadE-like protein
MIERENLSGDNLHAEASARATRTARTAGPTWRGKLRPYECLRRRRGLPENLESGAGTVLTVGFLFVVCTFTVVMLMIASTCASIAKAQNAADMVALGSAQRNSVGRGGCPAARDVEQKYGVMLTICDVENSLAKVKVSTKLTYLGVNYVAEAWAGPAVGAD